MKTKEKTNSPSSENLHAGHRKRMKDDLLLADLTDWSELHLLETLLFYSIPRVDTNEIAHRLLNEFKSLRGVLQASKDQLLRIQGVGEATWILIDTLRRLIDTEFTKNEDVIDLSDKNSLQEFFYSLTYSAASECMIVALLNRKKELVRSIRFRCSSEKPFVPAEIFDLDFEFDKRVKYCACAHVRPGYDPEPNDADKKLAYKIAAEISKHSIMLIDYFVVGNGQVKSTVNCEIIEV